MATITQLDEAVADIDQGVEGNDWEDYEEPAAEEEEEQEQCAGMVDEQENSDIVDDENATRARTGLSKEDYSQRIEPGNSGNKNETITITEMRRRKTSSKRVYERVDGLEHLSPVLERDDPNGEIETIYGITLAVIKLDLFAQEWDATARHNKAYPWQAGIEFGKLLHEELTALSIVRAYSGLSHEDSKIERYVRGLSKEQAVERLKNMKTISYLPTMLGFATLTVHKWNVEQKLVEKSHSFDIPKYWAARNLGRNEYMQHVINKSVEARTIARSIHKVIVELHRQSVKAASLALLDQISLEVLRKKFALLRDEFNDLCDELGKPRDDLVLDVDTHWPDPKTPEPEPGFIDISPKNIAHAVPVISNRNTNSTLTFLVPVTSILSCIPSALAWAHSSHQTGTIQDADFFQLIASSAMQILGILTLIIPTLSNARLVGHPWFWTWAMAAASMVCSMAALPLYLTTPTEWSAAISFAGTVLQAFVTLQLMFAI